MGKEADGCSGIDSGIFKETSIRQNMGSLSEAVTKPGSSFCADFEAMVPEDWNSIQCHSS